jgi:hypothetical protein
MTQPASATLLFALAVVLFPPAPETVISTEAAHSLVVLFPPAPETVISTEADHSLIVSSAAEKSASLPPPSLSHSHLPLLLPLSFFSNQPKPSGSPSIAPSAMGESQALDQHNGADTASYRNSPSRQRLTKDLVLLKGTASAVPKKPGRRPYRSAEGWSEATDLLPLSLPLHLFFAFSAQKSHVKPQNHLNPSNQRKSSWQVS